MIMPASWILVSFHARPEKPDRREGGKCAEESSEVMNFMHR
jgi:hypothetical protein